MISEVKPVDKDELRATMELMKRSLPVYIDYTLVVAQIRRASFDAHIAQKFSPEQALELCKRPML